MVSLHISHTRHSTKHPSSLLLIFRHSLHLVWCSVMHELYHPAVCLIICYRVEVHSLTDALFSSSGCSETRECHPQQSEACGGEEEALQGSQEFINIDAYTAFDLIKAFG